MNCTTQAKRTVLLRTTFDGRPAPGGVFDKPSCHFLKKCKKENAGRHPRQDALGGIDESVVEQLRRLDCVAIWLELADGSRYRCPFEVFLANSFAVAWKDARFSDRRLYLASHHWEEA